MFSEHGANMANEWMVVADSPLISRIPDQITTTTTAEIMERNNETGMPYKWQSAFCHRHKLINFCVSMFCMDVFVEQIDGKASVFFVFRNNLQHIDFSLTYKCCPENCFTYISTIISVCC